MDTRLLSLVPTEQARCREIARHYATMGSIGCFAAALIEQALQRADRAIIEGGEDAIRAVLRDMRAFNLTRTSFGKSSPTRPTRTAAPMPSPGADDAAPVPLGRGSVRLAYASL